jgi:hypothetical protein
MTNELIVDVPLHVFAIDLRPSDHPCQKMHLWHDAAA